MNEILHDITLRNFRSYSEASYEFENGVNIIVGPNASGKTNLLEAVHCVCFGKGIRGSDSGMIRHGEDWLRLEARSGDNTRSLTLEKDTVTNRSKKKITINGTQLHRMKFDAIIPVVVFQPDDLRLTSGSPERRRDYIDKLLTQVVPTYRSDLLAYERILRQRNAALKNGQVSTAQIFAWNIQLASRGARLVKHRSDIITRINERVRNVYSSVAGKEYDISFTYSSVIPVENYSERFLSLLEKNMRMDMDRGTTSVGPHRDDILVLINNKNMKDVASRGENRTLVLALKIIELDIIEEVHNKHPLLLLDDVFSELDGLRRRKLTSHLRDRQSILTTTDADLIHKSLGTGNIIAF